MSWVLNVISYRNARDHEPSHIMLVTSLRSILRRSSVLPTQIYIRRNQSSIEAEFDGLLNLMREVGELSPHPTFAESNSMSLLAPPFHKYSSLQKAVLMAHTRKEYTASFGTG